MDIQSQVPGASLRLAGLEDGDRAPEGGRLGDQGGQQDRPVAAGEGAIVLMERLWPTFQDIDTSSGALGTAVNATLEEIIPILIAAPAMPKVRAAWLERLYQAVQEDGVQYLYPVEERWGEVAVFPELMNE